MSNSRTFILLATLQVLFLCITSVACNFCVSDSSFAVSSVNGRLEVSGAPVSIKGLNWWGAETSSFTPGGLNTRSMADLLDFMKNNSFNGIRLPFTLDMALNPTKRYPNSINYWANPTLEGLTTIEVFDAIFEAAAERGIVILLDQHRFDVSQSDSTPLWYTTSCITNPDGVCTSYTIDDAKKGWAFMVNRYQSYWNFLGTDLFNEPHGAARWGSDDSTDDWALAAAEIGNYLISSFPDWKGLIFVEGVELNPNCEVLGYPGCETCTSDGHWWGGNMEGVRCAGVELSDPTRLVYSPHVYGSSVYDQPYFSADNFPNNLDYIYQTHFGFVMNATERAVVIGEWGGYYTGTDKTIQDTLAAYFKDVGISSTFYWALNPNPGGDTDGCLDDDWSTPNQDKLDFLAGAHPTPTVFSQSGEQVCISAAASGAATAAPTAAAATAAPTAAAATAAATEPVKTQAATAAPTAAATVAATAAPTKPGKTQAATTTAPTSPANTQAAATDAPAATTTPATATAAPQESGSESSSDSDPSASADASQATTTGAATPSGSTTSSSETSSTSGDSSTTSGADNVEESAAVAVHAHAVLFIVVALVVSLF